MCHSSGGWSRRSEGQHRTQSLVGSGAMAAAQWSEEAVAQPCCVDPLVCLSNRTASSRFAAARLLEGRVPLCVVSSTIDAVPDL